MRPELSRHRFEIQSRDPRRSLNQTHIDGHKTMCRRIDSVPDRRLNQTRRSRSLSYMGRSAQDRPRNISGVTQLCKKRTGMHVQSNVKNSRHSERKRVAVKLQGDDRFLKSRRVVVQLCGRLVHAVPEKSCDNKWFLPFQHVVDSPSEFLSDQ